MATVTGLTAERMLEIEAASVVGGVVVGDDLILTNHAGGEIVAGNVRGPEGPANPGIAQHARVRKSAAQSIPNNVWTTVTFDTEVNDVYGMHNAVTNTGRLTIQEDGVHGVKASVGFVPGAGTRGIRLIKNGDPALPLAVVEGIDPPDASNCAISTTADDMFDAGDYVEVQVKQDSGGALNTLSGAQTTCAFSATRFGN